MVSQAITCNQILRKCRYFNYFLYYTIKRTTSSAPPTAVFIQKSELPIITIDEHDTVDLIGPPDAVSNLRPIIRSRLINESALQLRLRELQDTTQAWNQTFWTNHNKNFIKEREEFINSKQIPGDEKKQLTPDEMSEFYKFFLDKYWKTHLEYNLEWYKKNFTLLFLALRVALERSIGKLL